MGNAYTESGKRKRIKEKTFKEFLQNHLEYYLEDIANHGAACGYPWLTYTSDTVILFELYGEEIWELARSRADDMGQNVGEFIGSFKRVDMLESLDTMKNLMVWFAAEEYAIELTEQKLF